MRHSAKREIGKPGERARSGVEREPPFSELDISLHSIPHLEACSQVTGRHAKEASAISRVIARDFSKISRLQLMAKIARVETLTRRCYQPAHCREKFNSLNISRNFLAVESPVRG